MRETSLLLPQLPPSGCEFFAASSTLRTHNLHPKEFQLNIPVTRRIALASFLFAANATSAEADPSFTTLPNHCHAATSTVLHRSLPGDRPSSPDWAVVRVEVGRDGLLRSDPRVLWQSGDAAFSRRSVRAVAATAFTPASRLCRAVGSAFDYAVLSTPRGTRIAKILPAVTPEVANRPSRSALSAR
jgi:hypothetical protein